VRANPRNPRKLFSEAELTELSDSIRERGIIQPIVVRARGADNFEIIAGERRWRAAQRANLHEVPIVVLDVTDGEALELAIIENVQRTDLNPLEEATGYQSLANEFNHSQDDIAKVVGKSRSHIANTLRLLKLPETVKAYINSGKLTAGHARALINHPDPEAAARDIVEKGLNVRQVEALGQEQALAKGKTISTRARASASKDADTLALEQRLSDMLGLVVGIDHRGKGGVLRVRYRTLDQLDEVIRRLESGPSAGASATGVRRT
jgi:ParB family chromosome partitioning protein